MLPTPVVVDGQTYAVGDVVMTLTTDELGHASTGNDVLPYGTYEVRESATNESMLLTWAGRNRHRCGRMVTPFPSPLWTR